MKEVTTSIDDSSYVWQKINSDGSHDLEWESSMVGAGNVITVGSEVAGPFNVDFFVSIIADQI